MTKTRPSKLSSAIIAYSENSAAAGASSSSSNNNNGANWSPLRASRAAAFNLDNSIITSLLAAAETAGRSNIGRKNTRKGIDHQCNVDTKSSPDCTSPLPSHQHHHHHERNRHRHRHGKQEAFTATVTVNDELEHNMKEHAAVDAGATSAKSFNDRNTEPQSLQAHAEISLSGAEAAPEDDGLVGEGSNIASNLADIVGKAVDEDGSMKDGAQLMRVLADFLEEFQFGASSDKGEYASWIQDPKCLPLECRHSRQISGHLRRLAQVFEKENVKPSPEPIGETCKEKKIKDFKSGDLVTHDMKPSHGMLL